MFKVNAGVNSGMCLCSTYTLHSPGSGGGSGWKGLNQGCQSWKKLSFCSHSSPELWVLGFTPRPSFRSIKVWMENRQIKTPPSPAPPPDLNPIKNIWNLIRRRTDAHKPSINPSWLDFCGLKTKRGYTGAERNAGFWVKSHYCLN